MQIDDFIDYIDDDLKDLLANGMIDVDGSATGVIDYERDADWFRIDMKGGHTYEIAMDGAGDALSDPVIRGIYKMMATAYPGRLMTMAAKGLTALLTFTPEVSGTYYVVASSYGFPYGDMPIPYATGSYTSEREGHYAGSSRDCGCARDREAHHPVPGSSGSSSGRSNTVRR